LVYFQQAEISIIHSLIIHAEQIGLVSDDLFGRATLLETCFETDCGVDQELDGSQVVDAANAVSGRRGKKKKKRSGSLQGRA